MPRAKELLEKALASDLRNLGEDHPSIATSRFNLAGLAEAAGELEDACALLEEALVSELRTLGADHPSLAFTRARLASVLRKLGVRDRAAREAAEAMRVVGAQPVGSDYRVQVERLAGQIL